MPSVVASDDPFTEGSFSATTLASFGAPSPMADGVETPFTDTRPFPQDAGGDYEIVKVGHTSLHNPGGRSSWIGL
jgi:protein arginine N-methyltransferase 5